MSDKPKLRCPFCFAEYAGNKEAERVAFMNAHKSCGTIAAEIGKTDIDKTDLSDAGFTPEQINALFRVFKRNK